MDVCLWNINHLYNTHVQNMLHLDFRRKVANHLIGLNTARPSSPSACMANMYTVKKVDTRKRCSLSYKEETEKYPIRT